MRLVSTKHIDGYYNKVLDMIKIDTKMKIFKKYSKVMRIYSENERKRSTLKKKYRSPVYGTLLEVRESYGLVNRECK